MPQDLQQMINLALQNHQAGRLQQAETGYRKVLAANPEHPVALNLLGTIAHQSGNNDAAEQLISKAVNLAPDYAEAFLNLGIVQRHLGKLAEAQSSFGKVLGFAPDNVDAQFNLGIVARDLGRLQDAIEHFRKTSHLKPAFVEAHVNLGNVLRRTGQASEAVKCYRKAIDINPQLALAHNNLGNALSDLGQHEDALTCFQTAVELDPSYSEAHYNLGNILISLDQREAAILSYQAAIALQPSDPVMHNNLGNAHLLVTDVGSAMACFRDAIELAPDYAEAHNNLGTALKDAGRFSEAEQSFRQALTLKPDYAAAMKNLTPICDVHDDSGLVSIMESLHGNPDVDWQDRMLLGFALGDVYEQQGRYAESASCYIAANASKREHTPWNLASHEALCERIRETFTADMFKHFSGQGDTDTSPIFIVGMPRSGTSLVEQILASHPDVHGAGELPHLGSIVQKGMTSLGTPYPQGVVTLDNEDLAQMGADYVKMIRGIDATAKFITDKMPENFLRLGMIRLILPNARIIHLQRDPLDTCLSIFSKHFTGNIPYAYDLDSLAGYYRSYEALMVHWRNVIPDACLDIAYEAIAEHPSAEITRLLDFCGLPFHEDCLNFHQTQRTVQTASAAQVRKPVYTSSIGRWRHFQSMMEPLRRAIDAGART